MSEPARNQVQYAWLVDPQAGTLEVYQPAGAFWQQLAVHAGDELVRAAPFQEVELELAS